MTTGWTVRSIRSRLAQREPRQRYLRITYNEGVTTYVFPARRRVRYKFDDYGDQTAVQRARQFAGIHEAKVHEKFRNEVELPYEGGRG